MNTRTARPWSYAGALACLATLAFSRPSVAQSCACSWTTRPSNTGASLLAGAYGPLGGINQFVFVGQNGTIAQSVDGANWISQSLGGPTYFDVATNGTGIFMTAGGNGVVDAFGGGSGARFNTSILWSGVAYGAGVWMIVGGYLNPQFQWQACWARTTNNGASWSGPFFLQTDGGATDNFLDVDYSNGLFTAVRGNGRIYQSNDGLGLSEVPRPTASSLQQLASNGNTLVAVGSSGTICRSTNNGASWSCGVLSGNPPLATVVFGGGTFVASGLNGRVYRSSDGSSWASCTSPATSFLQGAAYGTNTWVLSGEVGEIIQTSCRADLASAQPPGWSGSIVVAPQPGTTTEAQVTDHDTIYVDAAWTNAGATATPVFTILVRLNGAALGTLTANPVAAGAITGTLDVILGTLPAGDYVLTFDLDSNNVVSEGNEGNNRLSHAFTVNHGCVQDFNGDGTVNPDDLGDYINCYFAAPPCARADFNRDGSANPDDLGDFINAYFGPAC